MLSLIDISITRYRTFAFNILIIYCYSGNSTVHTRSEGAGISATCRHRQPRKMDGSGAERLDNAAVT